MAGAKIPYLYITGASYSGSTLLAFLLNAHPRMVSIGEQRSKVVGPTPRAVIERYRCSCGALLLQCPFFLEVERQINALGSSFKLTHWQTLFQLSQHRWLNIFLVRPLRYTSLERIRDQLVPFWPGYRHTVRVTGQRVVHLAQAALAISGKETFVDAQKDAIRVKFLRDIGQLDLKVVHLVRDVRGAVASYIKNTRNEDVAWATHRWSIANAESERAQRYVSPHQWLRITYDELCTDPQGTVDRITDFVGVKRAPIPEDIYDGEHHIIGNRMRLRGKGSGGVTLDESWKDRLTGRELEIIARIGGAANRRYGHHWP
jgi:hypothetical protein